MTMSHNAEKIFLAIAAAIPGIVGMAVTTGIEGCNQCAGTVCDQTDAEKANEHAGDAEGVHEHDDTQNERQQGGDQDGNTTGQTELEGIDGHGQAGERVNQQQNAQHDGQERQDDAPAEQAEQTDNQKEDAEQFVAGVRPAAALGAEICPW